MCTFLRCTTWRWPVPVLHDLPRCAVDVGYTLPSIAGIIDEYATQWFPKALTTIAGLQARGGPEQFVWTTHPWLLQRILNNDSTCLVY